MIKRILYFGTPVYLYKKNDQLVAEYKDVKRQSDYEDFLTNPIEDIGAIVLDSPQLTISQALMSALLTNNCAIITCNEKHLPTGLMLNLDGNTLQTERFETQITASKPLKKQLWQQTIQAKIKNQAELLKRSGKRSDNMLVWSSKVKSGDSTNLEARAAAYYWKNIFDKYPNFTRDRMGDPPNNLLNYGYAILRAIVARALVSSGLLPTAGIHHSNKYNAYCLADDIMEPFRPFVDEIVLNIIETVEDISELTPKIKKLLFAISSYDIILDGDKSPLMVGLHRTTSSLNKCYENESRKIIYPEFIPITK